MEPISSLQNPRIKNAVRLRQQRDRTRQGLILIDGTREISRALDAQVAWSEIFVCQPLCQSSASRELLSRLMQATAPLVPVTESVFSRLAYGQRTEGLLAVAQPPRLSLADLALPASALIAVLEGIEKPGNVGAVLRSADGAGLAAVIVAGGGTDLYNPNCIRASLGTIFTMPVCAATNAELMPWLAAGGWRVITARVDAPLNYAEADYKGRAAIILGSEATGLSQDWQGAGLQSVRLPMRGSADSLNVSTTAAVLFYEALRQRSG
jgi:RNA methyltransferase, TrmH family